MGGYWLGGVGGEVGAGEVARVLRPTAPTGGFFSNDWFTLIEIEYLNCMSKASITVLSYIAVTSGRLAQTTRLLVPRWCTSNHIAFFGGW